MCDREERERLLLTQAQIMMRSAAYAERTLRFYAENWASFGKWCEAAGRVPLPALPETLVLYLTDLLLAPRRVSTVLRHLTSIRHYHVQNGFPSPVTVDLLRRMSEALRGKDAMVARNRSVLTLGFASALRRESLTRLDLADITFEKRGLLIEVRNEKQDRAGRGRLLAVARGEKPETCPARALEEWVRLRGSHPGPLFTPVSGRRAMIARLNPSTIAYIVKTAAASLGLERAEFGAHSLRAGLVTTSFQLGHNEISIARQTGHRSLGSLRHYLRENDPFRTNISGSVGL